MSIHVRPGDVSLDREAVVELLAHNLNPEYDKARFDWLYCANPAGRGRLWVAVDESWDEIVGTAAAFPRAMYVNGREAVGWVLGDFCVARGYRTLGPALLLQRTCLEALSGTPGSIWYDFPGPAMMPVYRRLGLAPATEVSRLVKLLRVDGKLADLVPSPALVRGLSLVANGLLRRSLKSPGTGGDLTFELEDTACGEEFSELACRVGPTYGVCLNRSAAYLNWRYRDNPIQRCEMATARRGRRLVAYVLLSQEGDRATLVDIFGTAEPFVIGDLIRWTLELIRKRGGQTVSVILSDFHPWLSILRRLGFGARESAPLMLHVPAHAGLGTLGPDTHSWFLTAGDRDT